MVYGVYANDSLVHWSPSFIFANEIKVRIRSEFFKQAAMLIILPDHRLFRSNELFPSGHCLS